MNTLEYIIVRQAIINFFHTRVTYLPFYYKGGEAAIGVTHPNHLFEGKPEALAKLEENRLKTLDEIVEMEEFKKFF